MPVLLLMALIAVNDTRSSFFGMALILDLTMAVLTCELVSVSGGIPVVQGYKQTALGVALDMTCETVFGRIGFRIGVRDPYGKEDQWE